MRAMKKAPCSCLPVVFRVFLLSRFVLSQDFLLTTGSTHPPQQFKSNLFTDYGNQDSHEGTTKPKIQERRGLKQIVESKETSECSLAGSEVKNLYDRQLGLWVVDEDALRRPSSLQSIVNCTNEGDIILINTTQKIRVEATLLLPRSLTISAYVNDTGLHENVFPKSEKKISFSCPRNESLFRVMNGSITLANLAIEDCNFEEHRKASAVRVEECQDKEAGVVLRLHHMIFQKISNTVGKGVMDMSDEASVTSELVDVQIINNICGTIACIYVSGSVNFTNVTLSENKRANLLNNDRKAVMRLQTFHSNLSFHNVIASNNALRVFYVKNVEYVSITESRFSKNSDMTVSEGVGRGGGVFRLDNVTNGIISKTEFSENTMFSGAGLKIINSTLTINSQTTFLFNLANRGAAIHADNSTVIGNDLNISYCHSTFRGVVYVQRNSTVEFYNSTFNGNEARNRGGAIYASDSVMFLHGVLFDRNNASMSGGAVFGENTLLTVIRSIFINNLSTQQFGGAVGVNRMSHVNLTDCHFIRNTATSGGAFHSTTDGNVTLSNCIFVDNKALNQGGALKAKSSNVTILGCEFARNRANVGGALSASLGTVKISGSHFFNNLARAKCGALYTDDNGFINLFNSVCSRNSAKHGGCACIGKSSQLLSSSSIFKQNKATKAHGGAFLVTKRMNRNIAVQLVNCTIERNEARLGGAVYVERDAAANEKCYNNESPCGGIALLGTTFLDNIADVAGSAIFTNDEEAIRVACKWPSNTTPINVIPIQKYNSLKLLSNTRLCRSWTLNNNLAKPGTSIVAFKARSAEVKLLVNSTEGKEEVLKTYDGNTNKSIDLKSGDIISKVMVRTKDRFGTYPAFVPDMELNCSFSSWDELFQGIVPLNLSHGECKLTNLRVLGTPKTYSLWFNFSDPYIPSIQISVIIRHCMVGESSVGDEFICEECGERLYRFKEGRSKKCLACPNHANCSAKFIFPENGYWNDHPCQTNAEKCLERFACTQSDRFPKLKDITMEHQNCSYDTEDVSNYTNALCSEGYSGVLCGSCSSGYGKSGAFTCGKCWSPFISVCVFIASTIWLLGLAILVIRSNMPLSEREIKQSRIISAPANEQLTSVSQASFNVEMVRMMCAGVVSTLELESQASTIKEDPTELIDVEVSKWKVGEMLKVMVNYAQTIAIAAYLNVDWTASIANAFAAAETIGGFATHAIVRSIYCLSDKENSIHGPLFSMLAGLLQPVVVYLIIIVVLSRIHRPLKSNLIFFAKKAALVASIVAYISYLNVTKLATRPFPCVDVHVYKNVSYSIVDAFWAMDTSLKCYSKEHLLLLSLGVFVLLFFTVAFPMLVLLVLLHHRSKGTLGSSSVFDTLGFMYKAFHVKYVYWESFVLLRKAVLSVLLIFSYKLGAEIQTQVAAFVLVFSLYWQQRCSPYGNQFSELNGYESLSLFMTSLTFISGLFFHHEDTLETVKIVIACLLLISNIIFFLVLALKFIQYLIQYFRLYVIYFGAHCSNSTPLLQVIRSYICLKISSMINSD